MSTLKVDTIQNTSGVDNQGKVIQVVNFTDAVAQYTSTSTSFLDTGFGVTITPKFANSKILINVCATGYSSSHYVYLDISRNGTTFLSGGNGNGLTGPSGYYTAYWQTHTTFAVDSPNTTSAVTYDLYARTGGGTLTVGPHTTSAAFPNGVYMTATEIAQ